MIQLASYNFSTIENPLSNGGKFTTCPTMSPLQVPSANVCEASVISTHCGAYWSAAVPPAGNWPADQYAEITISSDYVADATGYFIPLLRQSSAIDTDYRAYIITGVNNALFQAHSAGVAHQIGPSFTLVPAANDVWRFIVIGNVLLLTQNGTQVATTTDSNNYAIAGSPGLDLFAATLTKEKVVLWAGGGNPGGGSDLGPAYDFKLRF